MTTQPNNVTSTPIPGTEDDAVAIPPAGAKNTETEGRDDHMIPKSRFDEVNQQRKALIEKVAEFERREAERKQAEEEAERKRLEEQGKFKELAEQAQQEAERLKAEHEAMNERAQKLEAALQTYLDKEMEGVPEYVAPLLEKLDVTERLAWLAENRSQWSKAAGGPPPSPKPGETPALDEEERRKRAARIRF